MDGDRESCESHIFVILIQSGAAIEFEAMPRANDVVPIQRTLAQRTAGMRAKTLDAMQFSFNIAKRVGEIASFDLFYSARWQLAKFADFDQRHIFTIASYV